MKIDKSKDIAMQEAPMCSKGTNPWDNAGIMPHEKAIPDTPGQKATNDTSAESFSSAQPFKTKGSGYTK